jgi:hypothetical protein
MLASGVCVRLLRVAVETSWSELSLLGCFLLGRLLGSRFFRGLLLSTFFSCHS